jgi:hypothetical protein
MAKFFHPIGQDGGLAYLKTHGDGLAVIRAYSFGDSYATVNSRVVAVADMTSADYTLSDYGSMERQITIAAKSPTVTVPTGLVDNGRGSGGTSTTLTDAAKAWAVNGYAGRLVSITGGTGAGQKRAIVSNTADTVTVDSIWATTPDSTSDYLILDNLHVAVLDRVNSVVLYVTDETDDNPLVAGVPVDIPACVYRQHQPV